MTPPARLQNGGANEAATATATSTTAAASPPREQAMSQSTTAVVVNRRSKRSQVNAHLRIHNILPPYAKCAIFFACGLEVFYNAFVMAINQKFFEMSSKIFPPAFAMFNDTIHRGGATFDDGSPYEWNENMYSQLKMYQSRLVAMWFMATCTILYSMLCVVAQFCEHEEADGNNRTWCMKKPILGWVMAPILVVLVTITGGILLWQWQTAQVDSRLFHDLFRHSIKEERYLSVIERELNCVTDDDKEADDQLTWEEDPSSDVVRQCTRLISSSMLSDHWMNPLLGFFFAYHVAIVLFFGFFNREDCRFCAGGDTDACEEDEESGTRLI